VLAAICNLQVAFTIPALESKRNPQVAQRQLVWSRYFRFPFPLWEGVRG
jgi:hypothetical protein